MIDACNNIILALNALATYLQFKYNYNVINLVYISKFKFWYKIFLINYIILIKFTLNIFNCIYVQQNPGLNIVYKQSNTHIN